MHTGILKQGAKKEMLFLLCCDCKITTQIPNIAGLAKALQNYLKFVVNRSKATDWISSNLQITSSDSLKV